VEIDEQATVHRVADHLVGARSGRRGGEWSPVLVPAAERWLDVALVVDGAASMAIFWQTAVALHRLLAHTGMFRDVRGFTLATEPGSTSARRASVELFRGLTFGRRGVRCDAASLADPRGRRVVVVVTDMVSQAWRDGSAAEWLRRVGRKCP